MEKCIFTSSSFEQIKKYIYISEMSVDVGGLNVVWVKMKKNVLN